MTGLTRKKLEAELREYLKDAFPLHAEILIQLVFSTYREIRFRYGIPLDHWTVSRPVEGEDHSDGDYTCDPRDSRNRCFSMMHGEHFGIFLIDRCEDDRDYNRYSLDINIPEASAEWLAAHPIFGKNVGTIEEE